MGRGGRGDGALSPARIAKQYHTQTNARARTRRKNHTTHAQRTELMAAAAAKQASVAAAQCRLRCLLIRPV